MRIGIVAFHLFRTNKHGMDIAALELIKSLVDLNLKHKFYIFSMGGPDDKILDQIEGIKVIKMPDVPYPFAEQVILPFLAKFHKIDLLHCTSNTAPLLCRVPTVVTLHDVIFMEYNLSKYRSLYHKTANLYRKLIVPYAIKKAKKIITVSSTEVSSISKHFPETIDKLEVIPNAIAAHFYASPELNESPDFILPKRYIFFHGNGDPKKNLDGVLIAFASIVEEGKADFQLLLSELDDKNLNKTLQRLNLKHIRSYVIAAGYIPNKKLSKVYNKALIFLYPGIRESFGLPIIEAMACGVPVITSNRSALPETAGDAALYINPLDNSELKNAILHLLENQELRISLIQKGIQRALVFKREFTAQQTITIYESVLKKELLKPLAADKTQKITEVVS